jgi:hypothetical protein
MSDTAAKNLLMGNKPNNYLKEQLGNWKLEEFYYFQQMERGPQWGYMLQHLAGQFLP